MTLIETVGNAMMGWPRATSHASGVFVPTHCLYPSNAVVRVCVSGRLNEFRVHDDGGALDEFESSGGVANDAIATIRNKAREQGLGVTRAGLIHTSEAVGLDQVAGAIVLVANASKEAAHLLLEKYRAHPRRNFRQELAGILELKFGRLSSRGPVVGMSNKPHKFDYDIRLSGDRRLLIDAVVPEASSINAVLVSNIDVKQAERSDLIQRIVYDDHDDWKSSDLTLLSLGATVVPYTRIQPALERLAA